VFVTAAVALRAQKTVFQQSALEIFLKLLTNELGQAAAGLFDFPNRARVMLGNKGEEGG
jgi:hypothetical protein